jgi:methionyl-tRNA formyltransferase
MSQIRTIFIGTPEFALPALKALARDTDFLIKAVITQPDMPSGRNLTPTPPPVKDLALKYNLAVLQPQKISQILDVLRELEPDLIVVAAYAQIIPEAVLNLPKYGCINIHPSLLPKYRGASPVHAAILNGDKETGVTIMLMDKTFDTGPILSQESLPIAEQETTITLLDKTAELGAKLLTPTIKKYIKGQIKPLPQDSTQFSYVKMFEKKDGLINWTKSAVEIERLIRALGHWPSAWTWIKGKQMKILAISPEPLNLNTYKPGKTFIYNNCLAVQCGTDALIIKRLKMEGKNEISGEDFVRGYKDLLGAILG